MQANDQRLLIAVRVPTDGSAVRELQQRVAIQTGDITAMERRMVADHPEFFQE